MHHVSCVVYVLYQRRSAKRAAIKTFLSCDHSKMLSLRVASMLLTQHFTTFT